MWQIHSGNYYSISLGALQKGPIRIQGLDPERDVPVGGMPEIQERKAEMLSVRSQI